MKKKGCKEDSETAPSLHGEYDDDGDYGRVASVVVTFIIA